jgi:aspartyl-tRNA synthetase
MSSEEDLRAAIAAKGEAIRDVKTAKAPTMKEDLAPLIAELLALKVSFKEVTGADFDPPKPEKKEKGPAQVKKAENEGPTKKELNKIAAKEAKAKAIAAKKAAEGAPAAGSASGEPAKAVAAGVEDPALKEFYGDSPLIRSAVITEKIYKDIRELPDWVGQTIWVRARLHTTRAVGKGAFLVMRQGLDTVQAIVWQSDACPKAMVKYAQDISNESIVDLEVTIRAAAEPVLACSLQDFELGVKQVHVVSRAAELPFVLEDAGRNPAEAEATGMPTVSQDTALNYRWVDLRTPANNAIFKIQSAVCQLFREYLYTQRFTEIHTPKLIGGASEGGSNVFTLKYFGENACLAQSPQLYKQMAAACGGLERVMEIGPVFRAENSNTHRHLCEFTGLDFEMCILEHYYEALDVMGNLFCYIFDNLNSRFSHELKVVSQQYPYEPLRYTRPTLRITFEEGRQLMRDAGMEPPADGEDIGTTQERELGKLVAEKYGTDFYIMDKYPLCVRPFYTMPDPENPELSNSYDLFIRGEEIVSGAQRIHDPDLLIERAKAVGIPVNSIQAYVDAFRHGALPHAGGGIGMERVVMLFLGLNNIRKASMFPRDPHRLSP